MGIAIGIPDCSCLKLMRSRGEWPHPYPPRWPIRVGRMGTTRGWGGRRVIWGRRGSAQFYWDTHRRQMWRLCIVPEAWQHWPYQPSRLETAVSVVHWYRVTRRLLWRSLKQPSVPLAGILYEKRPCTQQDWELQVKPQKMGPLACDS